MAGKEIWLLNPQGRKSMNPRRRRKHKRVRHRRRKISSYAMNPRRRRRRHFAVNPRRRHYRTRHRRYRHNPPPFQPILTTLGWASVGYMGTKIVGNMVTPMVSGLTGGQPLVRILIKLGVAYVTAWGAEMALGRRVFMPVMVGGSLEAVQDAVKTFIAPTFPMLAAYEEPLEVYLQPQLPSRGMSEYYQPQLSADYEVVQ